MHYSWTVLLDLALALFLTHHLMGRMLRNHAQRKSLHPLLSKARQDYKVYCRYRFDESGRLAFRLLMVLSLAYLVLPTTPWFAALAMVVNLMHLYDCHSRAKLASEKVHLETRQKMRSDELVLSAAVGV